MKEFFCVCCYGSICGVEEVNKVTNFEILTISIDQKFDIFHVITGTTLSREFFIMAICSRICNKLDGFSVNHSQNSVSSRLTNVKVRNYLC